MKLFLKNIACRWFCVDVRTLALFRIFIGLLSFFDIYRRYAMIDVFYSTKGIKLHTTTTTEYSTRYFSLLDSFPQSIEAHTFFIIVMACCLCLMLGYKTKFFQVLTAIGIISIHNHLLILENAGDMFLNAILIWTLFLPLGRVWSLDSLIKSFKQRNEINSSELNDMKNDATSYQVSHLAYFAVLLQFSSIYFFNFINKTGAMWDNGTAVYYLFQLETFLTPIGHLMQPFMIGAIISFFTYTTIAIEFAAPFLIFSPIWTNWTRRILFIAFFSFHFIIGISTYVGGFSWIMISSLFLLLSTEDIDYIRKLLSRTVRGNYIVFYDKDCGFCHFIARLIKRFDVFNRLIWADRDWKDTKPENIESLLETTIVVWDKESGAIWTRHEAFAKILRSIPFGCIPAFFLTLPLIENLCGYLYDLISVNRTRIGQFFGFTACGISYDNQENNNIQSVPTVKTPLKKYLCLCTNICTNITVFILIIGCTYNALQANEGIEKRWGKKDKKAKVFSYNRTLSSISKISKYPRMVQRWNMFSPTVLRTEKWIVAEATLDDGSKKFLFTDLDSIPKHFTQDFFPDYRNQFWRKFFTRLNKKNNKRYISDFKTWIMRTDYFDDILGDREIRNFKLWQLSESSHSPGKARRNVTKIELKKQSSKGTKKTKNNKSNQNNRKKK